MRSGHAAILGVIAALAPILPGCGSDEAATGRTAATTPDKAKIAIGSGEARAGAQGATTAAGGRPRRSAASKRCRRSLGELLDAIESLANAVAVGLDYERYLGAVNGVRSAYAGVDADRLGLLCLARVAGPAEGSLNAYIDAANEWGGCLAGSSCETEAIEARLQRRWDEASTRLARARSGLRSGGARSAAQPADPGAEEAGPGAGAAGDGERDRG